MLVRSAFVERHFGNFDNFFGGGGQHDRHLGHLACGGGRRQTDASFCSSLASIGLLRGGGPHHLGNFDHLGPHVPLVPLAPLASRIPLAPLPDQDYQNDPPPPETTCAT